MNPFADYKDFDECVRENQDKDDPEAYCASIKRQVEKDDTRIEVIGKSAGKMVIWGPANTEIRDGEGEIIKAMALEEAMAQLIKRARFSVEHSDVLVGEILEKWTDKDGTVYKTEVRTPTKRDIQMFPFLKQVSTLFVVGEVWDDNHSSQVVQKEIKSGRLSSFSISGVNLANSFECDSAGGTCANVISKLDLSAVTICQKGMNQHAKFKVMSKSAKAFFKDLCPSGRGTPCEGCGVMASLTKCSTDQSHRSCQASLGDEASQKTVEVSKMSKEEEAEALKKAQDDTGTSDEGGPFVSKADFDAFVTETHELIKSLKKEDKFVPPKEDDDEEKEKKRLEAEKAKKANDKDEDKEDEDKETITLSDLEKMKKSLREDIISDLLQEVKKGESSGRPPASDAFIQKGEKAPSFEEIKKRVATGEATDMLMGGL